MTGKSWFTRLGGQWSGHPREMYREKLGRGHVEVFWVLSLGHESGYVSPIQEEMSDRQLLHIRLAALNAFMETCYLASKQSSGHGKL